MKHAPTLLGRMPVIRSLALAATLALAPFVTKPALAADQVRISTSSFGFLFIPALVADELGYFKENGIDVEFMKIGSGSKALAAAVSGEAQFYLGPVSSAAVARANDIDVVVVGGINQEYDANVAISSKLAQQHGLTEDSTFEERLKALKGSRIAVTSPGSGTDQLLRYLAKTAELDPERDMTIVPISTAESMLAAFTQDRIDGFTISTPVSNLAVMQHGGFMLFHTAAGKVPYLQGYLYSAVITLAPWAEKNRDVVVRTLKSLQSGLDALQDPVRSAGVKEAIRAKYYSNIDADSFDPLWSSALPSFPKTIKATPEQISLAAEFTNEYGSTAISEAVISGVLAGDYADEALAKP